MEAIRVPIYVSPIFFGRSFLRVSCDRCTASIHSDHYHCLGCKDYDLCMDCALNGIYCQDDTHDWIKKVIEEDESGREQRFSIGGKITPSIARTISCATISSASSTKSYPSRFRPPHEGDTPQSLFASEHRFIRNSDPREILIYTDGACTNNGKSNPRAGFAFVFRPSAYTESGELTHAGTISCRLENRGPTGYPYKQTSNRAELRAVIAALQYRDWSTDCNRSWRSVVIATDSEYVAINATERIERWETTGWKTRSWNNKQITEVKNQDLWKLLLREIRKLQGEGVNVSFWPISRDWNERADQFAKRGVEMPELMDFQILEPSGPFTSILKPHPVVTFEEDSD